MAKARMKSRRTPARVMVIRLQKALDKGGPDAARAYHRTLTDEQRHQLYTSPEFIRSIADVLLNHRIAE